MTFINGAVSASSSTASGTCAVTYSPTAGNTIVGWGAGVGVDVSSVADNATGGSSTYIRLTPANNHTITGSLWGVLVVKSGVTTITFTMASSTRRACGVLEFSGVAAFGNSDGTATASSASPQDTLTMQDANNYIVTGMSREGTSTWSTHTGVGTLRENLAGAGSTTPGIGISTNTSASTGSLSAGATISASGTWIASAIELRNNAPVPITETETESDSVARLRNVPVAVSSTVSESDSCVSCKNAQNIFEGNVTVDSIGIGIGVSMADTVTELDSIPSMTEVLSELDSATAVHGALVNIPETVSELDSVAASHGTNYTANLPETLSVLDSIPTMTEILSELDSCATRKGVCNPVGFTEGNVTADSLAAVLQGQSVSRSLTESLTTAADIISARGNSVILTEPLSELDSVVCSHCNPVQITDGSVTLDSVRTIKGQVFLTEPLTESDSATPQRALNKAISETVTESDSVTGTHQVHNIVLTEPLTESDSSARSYGPAKSTVDTVTELDSVSGVKAQQTANLTEPLSESDSVIVVQCIAFPSEELTESDSVSIFHQAVGNVQESLFTFDSAAEATPSRNEQLLETQSTNDSARAFAQHVAPLTETLSHSDTTSLQSAHVAVISETLVEFDSIAAQHNGTPQFASMLESLAVSDSLSAQSAHIANVFENLTESDSSSYQRFVSVTMTENFVESDVPLWESGKGLTETNTTTDSIARGAQHFESLTEIFAANDLITTTTNHAQFTVNLVETLFQGQSQLALDNFATDPNENPLNSALWAIPFDWAPAQVLNGAAQGTTTLVDTFEYFSGAVLPNNQYASIKIGTLAGNIDNAVSVGVRLQPSLTGAVGTGYFLFVGLPAFGDTAEIDAFYPDGTEALLAEYFGPANAGDIFTLSAIGNVLTATRNGAQIMLVTDPKQLVSGFAGITIAAFDSLSNATITSFSAGGAVPADGVSTNSSLHTLMTDQLFETDTVLGSIPRQVFGTMSETLLQSDMLQARLPLNHKRFMVIDAP